ncbi:alpha/beta hydrolase [Mycobacterium sp. NPDC048908]|uniref:alpha/beta hydrolase n=1 Tax=Mycobacterium sp. NPDC048908 TaxID=3364292 RepID=UPI00371CD3FB
MIDRLLPWMAAGILGAGLLTATVAGAGIAVADDATTSGATKQTSAEPSNPTVRQRDSKTDSTKKPRRNHVEKARGGDQPSTKPADDDNSSAGAAHGASADPTPDPTSTDQATPKKKRDNDATELQKSKKSDQRDRPAAVAADAKKTLDNADAEVADTPAQEASTVLTAAAAVPVQTTVAEPTAKQSPVSTTPVAAPTQPTLTSGITNVINAVGNLVFNVLALVTNLAAGPPVLPPGSTVTVRRSTLDVGGKTVTADWYFPNESEPATGLIYLQHGAFAVGSMYSYTAADLAEQTNSIVVAPTMSTNGYAPDGMWLGGAPLQMAVADLFEGDRDALTASASAAAGHPVTLPQQFVLAGHSLGGGFVTATAADLAGDKAAQDLAGVILFDPVAPAGQDGVLATAFGDLPDDLPVLLIGSPPSSWNELGAAANALVAARPGEFVGVILDGGSHGDASQGGNPLIQLILKVATGVPRAENVAAAQTLASGWISDMFAGTQHGAYAAPGDVFDIDTPAGTATAYALPDTYHRPSPFQVLLSALVDFFTASMGNGTSTGVADVPAQSRI